MDNENRKIINHDWGIEVTWADEDDYCGKILVFEKKDMTIPLHFHKTTNKTWFVNAGKFAVTWINTSDGQAYSKELPEGSSFQINALTPVKLQSLEDNSAMAECSNANGNNDYYKLG